VYFYPAAFTDANAEQALAIVQELAAKRSAKS
jgi:hypothetical protein